MNLDAHDSWDENIPSPLSPDDLQQFQSRLDAVIGTEDDGVKRWRVVWGGDFKNASEWDRYTGRWVPKYRWKAKPGLRMNPATGLLERTSEWIAVPRYFVEALRPAVHRDIKEEAGGVDHDGDAYTERRVDGPEYVMMFCVCQHSRRVEESGWRACCLRRQQAGSRCFGRYRVPDDVDVETLAEDFHRRITSKLCGPNEPVTAKDKRFLYQAWLLDQMREEARVSAELDYRRNDILTTLQHGYDPNFGSLRGRFSIPGL
jgi:hypothetical protein